MGRFGEALAEFERAYALSHRPQLLFNIARAADADGRLLRAREAYTAYLRELPEAENRPFVEARVAKLADTAEPASSAVPQSDSGHTVVASTPANEARVAITSADAPAPQRGGESRLANVEPDVPEATRLWWKRGWFWTITGVVVAAGVSTALAVSLDRAPKRAEADERIMTLVAR